MDRGCLQMRAPPRGERFPKNFPFSHIFPQGVLMGVARISFILIWRLHLHNRTINAKTLIKISPSAVMIFYLNKKRNELSLYMFS